MTTFRSIVGHSQSLGILQRCRTEHRLHHSLLFHGPEGVGKRTVALALAAAFNCASSGTHPSAEPCGTCASCTKIGKGLHPDVIYLTLERTVIPIDGVRRLRREAAFRPFEGRKRVFIIDPADRMSIEAQNALLKTLEEPAASSCLILITSKPMHLLPTTRSRCQQLGFGTLPPAVLASHIAAQRGLSERDALRAARLAGGRLGTALTLDLSAHDHACEMLLDLLETLIRDGGPGGRIQEQVGVFGGDAEAISWNLDILTGLIRDMILLSSTASDRMLIHTDRRADLSALAGRLAGGRDVLLQMAERVDLARSDLQRNVNKKLLLETLLFDLCAECPAR
ncbi:MAG: DNA polymerase III subunit delta' [Acidobacteriota bacterium]